MCFSELTIEICNRASLDPDGMDYSFAANCTLVRKLVVENPEGTFEAAESQAPPPLPEPPKAALSPATVRLVRIKAGKKQLIRNQAHPPTF